MNVVTISPSGYPFCLDFCVECWLFMKRHTQTKWTKSGFTLRTLQQSAHNVNQSQAPGGFVGLKSVNKNRKGLLYINKVGLV